MLRHSILISGVIIFFSITSFAVSPAPKKCKCDEDAIFNRETKDETWNRYIHEGCASMQNKEYETAFETFGKALQLGEDKYIQALYDCIKSMQGISTTQSEKPSNSENENVSKQPTPVAEPVKPSAENKTAVVDPVPTEKPVATTASADSKPIPAVETDENVKETPRVFTAAELSSFQEKGMIKVNTFKNYLNKIGNKSISQTEGIDAIKNALKLFYGQTFVQVSSTSRPDKPKFPTKTYLERVRALNYDKVEIEWAECQYTSNLRKAPDGNYYGYIKFRQRFKGIKDGKVIYEDITDKTIAVILKAYDKAIEGEKVENFDIFLGDIDVMQTMKN